MKISTRVGTSDFAARFVATAILGTMAACSAGSISNGNPGDGTGATGSGGSTAAAGTGTGGSATGVKTALLPLPALTNVVAKTVDDDVSITFDPVDGARDYRVYALPDDKDVSTDGSG